ncbi:MAG: DUF3604 domain-containing protein [Eudoraea sp.]|uniref:DUF3604 domain-containing protein n=1 Tax=Eudoraea sp. TaxID=1979955 RepID=UPI003267638C
MKKIIQIVLISIMFGYSSIAQTNGEPGNGENGPNPLKNVYFGEEHMHTRNSFDAFTVGVSATWDDAYRFAMGEEIELSTTGEKLKRRTPYDFVTITDHSEYFGVLKDLVNPESPLSKTDLAKQLAKGKTDPDAAKAAVSMLIGSLVSNSPLEQFVTPELLLSNWTKFVAVADKYNKPGEFTTLYGFEWTSIPDGRNMHRNVFFRETPPVVPFSSFNSIEPEDLWTYLEIQRNQGIQCFAIPHNSNVSNGWMFSDRKFQGKVGTDGGKIDARYARRQQENEPLFEMFQTKGGSEAHPLLSPNDEFADFEQFPNLINLGVPAKITSGAFARQGLVVGMRIEDEVGYNPYKMGIVAGADVHSGYQGNEEFDWKGAHGNQDDTIEKRLSPVPNASGDKGYAVSSAGTTAVWATENTREGIFDAMKSKETYGTSGTLIRLRFFGGWDYDDNLTIDADFVKKAYEAGVPMGQDLKQKPASAEAPTFAVWALKDPESGNLDRVQIIKGWADPVTSYPREKIYEVVWSDDRAIDATTGKLPPVGNTVDVKKASYKNSIGDSQLSAVWTDPDFDPKMKAVYYVRVLEIPTPRWSTYDAVKLGVEPPKDVPASIQERAWSSPIWYSPEKK